MYLTISIRNSRMSEVAKNPWLAYSYTTYILCHSYVTAGNINCLQLMRLNSIGLVYQFPANMLCGLLAEHTTEYTICN